MDVHISGPILITGAASGIGLAVVDKIAVDGVAVALLDRTPGRAEDVARRITGQYGIRALGLDCDIASESSIASAYAQVIDAMGVPRGFVLNAGIEVNAPIHAMPTTLWDEVLGVNLRGTFLTLRAALQSLRVAEMPGSIVLTGSPAASVAYKAGGNGAYAASKAGLAALARCAAIESATAGIRVNVVVPGATRTELLHQDSESTAAEERTVARLSSEIPLHRLASPEEPAAAIAWLLSDAASYVTGSELVCDGGILALSSISS